MRGEVMRKQVPHRAWRPVRNDKELSGDLPALFGSSVRRLAGRERFFCRGGALRRSPRPDRGRRGSAEGAPRRTGGSRRAEFWRHRVTITGAEARLNSPELDAALKRRSSTVVLAVVEGSSIHAKRSRGQRAKATSKPKAADRSVRSTRAKQVPHR